ncbi:hypothetical protein L1987_01104 [Smallanthus sonchifolius]|uniref:Uncharacterized protein n=1 Tax=Smallanthus sonchifolius TaxID=185202 RepID=A0ACB9K457_9ASTR|nr:hypothetical protein L1987_01104 [Smallanthus sonchifolius]
MVMASFTVTPSTSLLRIQSSSPSHIAPLIPSYQQQVSGVVSCRRSRGSLAVTRAGAPGASTYLFAFLFPFSLLAVTIFTSIKISDKLDRDFYEELEVNQAILEAEDEDEDVTPAFEEPPSQQRTRNRPKREAEISGSFMIFQPLVATYEGVKFFEVSKKKERSCSVGQVSPTLACAADIVKESNEDNTD